MSQRVFERRQAGVERRPERVELAPRGLGDVPPARLGRQLGRRLDDAGFTHRAGTGSDYSFCGWPSTTHRRTSTTMSSRRRAPPPAGRARGARRGPDVPLAPLTTAPERAAIPGDHRAAAGTGPTPPRRHLASRPPPADYSSDRSFGCRASRGAGAGPRSAPGAMAAARGGGRRPGVGRRDGRAVFVERRREQTGAYRDSRPGSRSVPQVPKRKRGGWVTRDLDPGGRAGVRRRQGARRDPADDPRSERWPSRGRAQERGRHDRANGDHRRRQDRGNRRVDFLGLGRCAFAVRSGRHRGRARAPDGRPPPDHAASRTPRAAVRESCARLRRGASGGC